MVATAVDIDTAPEDVRRDNVQFLESVENDRRASLCADGLERGRRWRWFGRAILSSSGECRRPVPRRTRS